MSQKKRQVLEKISTVRREESHRALAIFPQGRGDETTKVVTVSKSENAKTKNRCKERKQQAVQKLQIPKHNQPPNKSTLME